MFTVTWDSFRYSSRQFAIWRIGFGAYLAYFYAVMIPFGAEIYSRDGIGTDRFSKAGFFPAYFLKFDSAVDVKIILVGATILSVFIMIGWRRRLAAFALWMLATWLYNRAPYADSPEQAFVNWLIFVLIFIPTGENYACSKKNADWYMPRHVYWGAWIVLCFGYFFAGSGKFRDHDPAWMSGSAMYHVLTTDNGRMAWYGNLFEHFPKGFFVVLTYGALCSQLLAGVFVAIRKTRPWWWLVATSTHFCLLFFVHLAQVTLGMLAFHFFIFDLNWINDARSFFDRIRPSSLRRNS